METLPTNPIVIVLLICLLLVSLPYLGMKIALTEAERRKERQASEDTRASDAQKAQEDKDSKILAAMNGQTTVMTGFIEQFKGVMTLLNRTEDNHEIELGIRKQNTTRITELGQTLDVLTKTQDDTKSRLEVIQGHGKQLEETRAMLGKVSDDISKLPDSVREKLRTELEDIRKRLELLETAVTDLSSRVDKAIEVVAAPAPQMPTVILAQPVNIPKPEITESKP
jgi:chromosome segregation ATPase